MSQLVFDSGQGWRLFKRPPGNSGFLLLSTSPRYWAILDQDFNLCRVYGAAPTDDPTDGLLSILWKLSRGQGVMFHGCGINDEGKGYLFLGRSGDGKSTLARLWGASRVIHEDRVVVIEEEKFWMQDGMPPRARAPIEKVFFLYHGRRNRMIRRDGAEAVSKMLTRCYAPRWDKRGMEFTMDFCIQLAKGVPCYDFWFRPDRSAVEYVRIRD